MERTALRELTFNGYVPRLTDPEGNAVANIHASVAGLGVSEWTDRKAGDEIAEVWKWLSGL